MVGWAREATGLSTDRLLRPSSSVEPTVRSTPGPGPAAWGKAGSSGHQKTRMAFLKAALTSACLMAMGDVFAQTIVSKSVDIQRTERFATVGLLLHGPYFYVAYSLIDKLGGIDPKRWLRKTLVSHVTVFPVYIVSFLSFLTVVERIPMMKSDNALSKLPLKRAIQKRVTENAWPIFRDGTAFWPFVNFVTFKLLPQGSQSVVAKVAWANIAGIAWQTYLSMKTNIKIPVAAD